MAVQSFLAYAAGKLARILPLQTSAGAASAGQIVALNGSGVVDRTMIAPFHGKFTGTSTFGFAISLGQTQTSTLSVTPAVAGDSLAAGEDISLQPAAALPAGINLAFAFVSAANTVTIGFTSSALITLGSTTINWRVTAHR